MAITHSTATTEVHQSVWDFQSAGITLVVSSSGGEGRERLGLPSWSIQQQANGEEEEES